MNNMSVLKEAREIVRSQPMSIYVGHLKACADKLGEAYDILKVSCTREAATNFIAAFNRTLLAIERVQAHTPPTPTGGRVPVPREEKALTASP
jgi:uncharacterized protein (UPF0276 family)